MTSKVVPMRPSATEPTTQIGMTAFTPIRIGPLTLRNRFIKAATHEGMAPHGMPAQMLTKHHEAVAAGGVGMTTVAYCAVSPDGRTFADQLMLAPQTVPALRRLTDTVHRSGAAICAQLNHAGSFTFLPELATRHPLSASSGINPSGALTGHLFRTGMSTADMAQIAGEFAAAAVLAREAGFDAVEIHMAHGYLLSQFLSPKYNRRTDDYGGSVEQRARFPAQVLRRVLDAVGRDLAVVCKLGATEGFHGGATAQECARAARNLEAEGAHLLVLSGGMNVESPWVMFGNPLPQEAVPQPRNLLMRIVGRTLRYAPPREATFREMYQIEHALQIRAAVQMPLAYLGGVKSRENIDIAMASGFDCVAIGRALIHDPGLVNQFRTGGAVRSGCTSCNRCVLTMYSPEGTHCVLHEPEEARA